ncbi:hypothetical protein [Glutamicibacter sp. X7]
MLVLSFIALVLGTAAGGGAFALEAPKRLRLKRLLTVLALALGALSGIFAIIGGATSGEQDHSWMPAPWIIGMTGLYAVLCGGPFTEAVFARARTEHAGETDRDPSPLKGGLWIGLLERTAIIVSLWAGWPEGIAVVMAIKGLGRFAELKDTVAAEQFILGTFSSGLTALAGYGLGVALLGQPLVQ